jgi:hypothetical protein
MNSKNLRILAIVAIVLAVVSLAVSLSDKPDQAARQVLLAGLAERINDVSSIEVFTAGELRIVKLVPAETGWISETNNGYTANGARVRRTLISLADANIVENKTAKPEFYSRLGVEDISAEAATGALITLTLPDATHSIIIGDSGVSGGEFSYVRRAGEPQSMLVSGVFDISKSTVDWLDATVIDVSSAEIESVEVHHPDGEVLRIFKDEAAASDFSIVDLPSGRELNYAGVANTLGSVLSNLEFLEAIPAKDFEAGEIKPVVARFKLHDGWVITAQSWQNGIDAQHTFSVALDIEQANQYLSDEATEEDGATADYTTAIAALQEKADLLNQRVSPWVYKLPAYKWEQLVRRMDDMLKEIPPPPLAGPNP